MRTQDLWWGAECEEKEKVAETATTSSPPPDAASVCPEHLEVVPASHCALIEAADGQTAPRKAGTLMS